MSDDMKPETNEGIGSALEEIEQKLAAMEPSETDDTEAMLEEVEPIAMDLSEIAPLDAGDTLEMTGAEAGEVESLELETMGGEPLEGAEATIDAMDEMTEVPGGLLADDPVVEMESVELELTDSEPLEAAGLEPEVVAIDEAEGDSVLSADALEDVGDIAAGIDEIDISMSDAEPTEAIEAPAMDADVSEMAVEELEAEPALQADAHDDGLAADSEIEDFDLGEAPVLEVVSDIEASTEAAASAEMPGEASGDAFVLKSAVLADDAEALAEELQSRRSSDLTIDAGAVERIDTTCVELMISAAKLWSADGQSLLFSAVSEQFEGALSTLGIQRMELETGGL